MNTASPAPLPLYSFPPTAVTERMPEKPADGSLDQYLCRLPEGVADEAEKAGRQ